MTILEIFFNNPVSLYLANILATEFITTPFIIDGWAFVHFFSGMILMFILIRFDWEKKLGINRYWTLFILLFVYELLEWVFFLSDSIFLNKESLFNSFIFDMGIGMFGGFVWDSID